MIFSKDLSSGCYKLCGEPIPQTAVASLACHGGVDITYESQSFDHAASFWTNGS